MTINKLNEFSSIESIKSLDLLAFSLIMKKHSAVIMKECKSNLRLRQVIESKLNKLEAHKNLSPIYLQYEV